MERVETEIEYIVLNSLTPDKIDEIDEFDEIFRPKRLMFLQQLMPPNWKLTETIYASIENGCGIVKQLDPQTLTFSINHPPSVLFREYKYVVVPPNECCDVSDI